MNEIVKEKEKSVVDIVAQRVRSFQEKGELDLPANYSPQNALKSAWLILQDAKDKNLKPALQVCTTKSVAEAMLSMIVQGLNPDKKQCYFIVYGDKLTMQRSYFGSIAVAKRVCPEIKDIIGEVVYQGDTLKTAKKRGKTIILEHIQDLGNMDKTKIVAAYATIIYNDDTDESIIMPMQQIEQAWKQSKAKVFDEKGNLSASSTHAKFTEEMAKKTVINRACKHIVNTSDDKSIMTAFYKQTEDIASEADAQEEADLFANKEMIDVAAEITISEAQEEPTREEEMTVDEETGEIIEGEQESIGPNF